MNTKSVCKLYLMTSIGLVMTASASAKSDDQAKIWASTGVPWSIVSHYVNDVSCNNDVHTFVSCVRALQTFAVRKDEFRVVIPATIEKALPVAQVMSKFGGLELVKLQRSPFDETDIAKAIAHQKRYAAAELVEIQRLFAAQRTAQKVVFTAALSNLHALLDPSLEALMIGEGINAYLGAQFDPHTHLVLDPSIDGGDDQDVSIVGIGVSVKFIGSHIVITGTSRGGPALTAGLHANDIIVSVDGAPVPADRADVLEFVVGRIRGKEGTTVKVTISRKSVLMDFTIVRSKITIPNFEMQMLNDLTQPFGYIRLQTFMDRRSCDQIAAGVSALQSQGAKGLIFDLRSNGGGLVDLAQCIAGIFAGPKLVAVFKHTQDSQQELLMGLHAQVTSLPLVVLVNAGSASASELVSGALQDDQRAWIVGERTFGKGSAQTVKPNIPWPKIDYAETFARFYQPTGRTNQGVGIQPDFEVHVSMTPGPEDLIFQRESDLYTNALPAVGEPWKQTRPEAVSKIQVCMQANPVAERVYADRLDGALVDDYQLLKAQAVLSCAN